MKYFGTFTCSDMKFTRRRR